MLIVILLAAILFCFVLILLVQLHHRRWIKRIEHEHWRLTVAHQRLAKFAQKTDLRVPKRAKQSWAELMDEADTRQMDAGETFLPVSFGHDLW